MATNKAQDPAAAALSAIEEALNLTGDDADAASKSAEAPASGQAAKESESDRALRLPEIEEHPLFTPKKSGKEAADFSAERAVVTPSIPPANDDRDSVGAMLRAINKKPSGAPYVVAALFSALWIGLAAFYLAARHADLQHVSFLTQPEIPLYAIAVIGPVIFFFITAVLARRAMEMRLTARSMVEIAMRLAEPESIATEQMVTLSHAIRREIVSMGDGIERALARASELETLVRSEVSNLERSYSDNERRIRALVEELSTEREAMQAIGERMRSAIGGARDSLSHELDAAATGLSENLSAAGNRVTMSLGAKAEEIRFALGQAGDQLIANLAAQAEDILGRLERTREGISQNLTQRIDEVTAQSDRINERLTQVAQDSLQAFAYHAGATSERFAETIGEAVSAIATHGERVNEALSERMSQFEQTVIGHGNVVADRLGDNAQQLSGLLAKQLEGIESVVSVQGGELNSKLEARARENAELFESQTRAFEDRAAAKMQEMAESLDSLIARVDSGLDGRANALNETLAARTLDIAKVLGEGGREVAQALEKRLGEIDEILSDRAAAITESLSAKADEVNEALGARATEIADTLDGRVARFEEHVVGRLDAISTDLDTRGRELSENLAVRVHDIDTALTQHTSNISAALDHESGQLENLLTGRAEALRDLLAQASNDLDIRLAERIGDIGGVLSERVTEIGTLLAGRLMELQTSLDERGRNLHEILRARSDEIHAVLETKGADLVGQLGERQAELTAALDQSSASFNEALAANAASSVESLIATNEKLKQEMAATVDALAARNAALQETIGSADVSFVAIETALAARIQQFEQAIASITKEMEDLGANAGTTIGSARALYETIAHQQQSLAAAAADLSRSQVELDRTLDERRGALETLLASVQSQREEFDNVMSSFSAIVDDSFRRVQGRAEEIGTFLAETSQTTAGLVERQFDAIRASIGDERERTATLLRAAYDQANAEIEGILGQSASRFQAVAAEMRGVSREIQQELEATREELRQNAVVLPAETAEQTAAMRRVVADQIKALNELTDIVARSGHSYDLSDPLTYGRDGGATRRLEQRSERDPASSEASRPEPPRARGPANQQRASGATDRGPGWLSDLLARASREEGQSASPLPRGPQAGEPLETISHDIARMVDHAAIADAWDKYRRGQANAFGRHLYIGRGSQTFEEIRRRYRSDVEFRGTVDRYVLEFERLLADVSRDDRDDALTRTYLISETGKVYTMLAHAAGRLGG